MKADDINMETSQSSDADVINWPFAKTIILVLNLFMQMLIVCSTQKWEWNIKEKIT